ncbi:MAG: family 1 glycosylhydrolase [Candidatus Saccharimonas sp.]
MAHEVKFPKGFLWGAVTSAHQIEGNNHNQWTVWELENATALAAQSSYQYDDLPIWQRIRATAKSPNNYISGQAAQSYQLFDQDLALARKLNLNSLRISIEWSRLQPDIGQWDAGALQHYKNCLIAMRKQGIEPVVTLFHYTLPVWFTQMGGFEKRSNVRYFVDFATRVLDELGGGFRYIITINEPQTYADMSYAQGKWPPQQTSSAKAMRVLGNLLVAHNKVADIAHAKNRRFKVGIAKNYDLIYPGDDAWLSRRSAEYMHLKTNTMALRAIAKKSDFIGINYKGSQRVYGYRVHNPNEHMSDVGAQMDPGNLRHVLTSVSEAYGLPVMVSGSGVADMDDMYRKWWLAQSLAAVQYARQDGAVIIGFLVYSLFDQYEWDRGFWPRYGLYAVDRTTGERTARPSAVWFAKVLKKLRSN